MADQNLFNLIKSLDKNEKRYFKRIANLHVKKGINKYIKLFDAIEKQNIYEEIKVISLLNDNDFTKNFSQAKLSLEKLILKALRNYHHNNIDEINLNDQINNIYIINSKKLYQKSFELLDKLKNNFTVKNNYNLSLIVNNLELTTAIKANNIERLNKLGEQYGKDCIIINKKINDEIIIRNSHLQIYCLLRNIGLLNNDKDRELAQSYINAIDKYNPVNLNTLNAIFFYQTKLFYSYIMHDVKTAIKYSDLIIRLYQSDDIYKQKNTSTFLSHKVNHLSLISSVKKNEVVEKYYSELVKTIQYNNEIDDNINPLYRIHSIMIFHYINNGKINDAERLVKVTSLDKSIFFIDEAAKLSLLIAHIWTYTIQKNYPKAIQELQYFIHTVHTKNASDFYIISRIIYTIILFEQENYKLLKSTSLNTLSQLKRIKRFDDSLYLFFTFFSKTFKSKDNINQIENFKILKNQLLELDEKYKLVIFNSLQTCAWIECKISGKNFDKIIINKKFLNLWKIKNFI